MHAALDRLEARLEDQAARIDALYALLELRGILPRRADAGRGDGLFDDDSEKSWIGRVDGGRRPGRVAGTRLIVRDSTAPCA